MLFVFVDIIYSYPFQSLSVSPDEFEKLSDAIAAFIGLLFFDLSRCLNQILNRYLDQRIDQSNRLAEPEPIVPILSELFCRAFLS